MNESVLSFKDKYFGDKNFYKMTLTIAIPIIIQNLLTNLVSMADNIMVGQGRASGDWQPAPRLCLRA